MLEKKDKLLEVSVVAKRLSCSNGNVYNLIKEGKLDAIRIGRRALRIRESSIDRFMDERKVDPDEYFE